MIYITGDMHGDFRRFSRRQRERLPFNLTDNDYVVVCGDFGLIWNKKDKEFEYNIDWLSRLPFTILFVDGNHEGFGLLYDYPVEMWNGGKVHHIARDKIIHLMRGQVFSIEGKTFFTFGGGSSHDISGGILDKNAPDYNMLRKRAVRRHLPYRVLNESWWSQELPSEEEMQEGRDNLGKAGYEVDYVISHCLATSVQSKLELLHSGGTSHKFYGSDILTDYFDELEQELQYGHWYNGHYHVNHDIDEKHTVLYKEIKLLKDLEVKAIASKV